MLSQGELIRVEVLQEAGWATFESSILKREGEHLCIVPPSDSLRISEPPGGSRVRLTRLESSGLLELPTVFVRAEETEAGNIWRLLDPNVRSLRGMFSRKHERTSMDMSATLEPFGGGHAAGSKLWAEINNISAGGALIATRQKLPMQQRLIIRFQLSMEGRKLSLRAKIVREVPSDEGHLFCYGIQFIDPPLRVIDEIKAFQGDTAPGRRTL